MLRWRKLVNKGKTVKLEDFKQKSEDVPGTQPPPKKAKGVPSGR